VLCNINVVYVPSGQAARRLGVSNRTLGRMTGNVWLQAGEERRDRVDVGLCVKNGAKAVYVPDFARPMMEGGEAKGAYTAPVLSHTAQELQTQATAQPSPSVVPSVVLPLSCLPASACRLVLQRVPHSRA
jgi:hypothetical protein